MIGTSNWTCVLISQVRKCAHHDRRQPSLPEHDFAVPCPTVGIAHATRIVLMVLVCTSLAGCSGSVSQDDMRRHAIRRSSDKKPPAAATNAPKTTDNKPVAATIKPVGKSAAQPAKKAAGNARPSPPATTKAAGQTSPPSQSGTALELLQRAPIPAQPLNLVQRRKRTLENLTRIGAAIKQYVHDNHSLFPKALCDTRGNPVLSWRVALLPYLGHQELYNQFRLHEPWDSPHNQALCEFIPAEFQSPERFDTKTNYLVVEGSSTPFHAKFGVPLVRVEDGLANTVAVVEADEESAVPWTRPQDLKYTIQAVRDHLGHLRQDGFFVAWCDGTISRVTKEANGSDLQAIFTYESGDSFSHDVARGDTNPEPAAANSSAVVASTPTDLTKVDTATSSGLPGNPPALRRSSTGRTSTSTAPRERQLPVPDAQSLANARTLAAQIYQDAYKRSRTAAQRQALARKILGEASKSIDDPPSHYVLLEIAMKMAIESADTTTALAAADQLVQRFDVDPLDLKYQMLTELVHHKRDRSGSAPLAASAHQLLQLALERDDFDKAETLCQIELAETSKLGDARRIRALHDEQDRIDVARSAYSKLRRILETGHREDSPEANLEAGKYYCLIKGDWERGLPLLAKSGNARLEEIATLESRHPTVAGDQIKLADRWWALAEDSPNGGKGAKLRASYWYEQAAKQLPHGLLKIKAEMRVRQVAEIN